jgi:hypothetical protein
MISRTARVQQLPVRHLAVLEVGHRPFRATAAVMACCLPEWLEVGSRGPRALENVVLEAQQQIWGREVD